MEGHEKYIRESIRLAKESGIKGHNAFGAVLVHQGEIIARGENTEEIPQVIFGHAEFNLVRECAGKIPVKILEESVLYASSAPCVRCLMAIASLGIPKVVYSVSYESFKKQLPYDMEYPDYQGHLKAMGVNLTLEGPVLEEEGLEAYTWRRGTRQSLEEIFREAEALRAESRKTVKE